MNTFQTIAAELLKKGYSKVGQGSKRAAYACPDKKHVIKVPINATGIMENFFEEKKYKENNIRLARCARTPQNLIIMEYVEPVVVTHETVLPYWCKEFDNQVGYNKKGQLVAYDYGC